MIAYLNGEFCELSECHINPLDRGFLFGDGVYEVMPAYGGRIFRYEAHLRRLDYSLQEIRIANPHTAEQWRQLTDRLIEQSGLRTLAIYLQITRGVAPRDHVSSLATTPTVFMMTMRMEPAAQAPSGVAAITTEDTRWQRCDIKSVNLLANVLMRQDAQEQGAYEAIITNDGYVSEGAASTVFVIKDNAIATPALNRRILPGITRAAVIEIAERENVACVERQVKKDELFAADEVWLTSSTKDIVPVTRIDNTTIGDGQTGALCKHFSNRIMQWRE